MDKASHKIHFLGLVFSNELLQEKAQQIFTEKLKVGWI